MNREDMRAYRVSFREPHAPDWRQTFRCLADSPAHAREQCANAYPRATVGTVRRVYPDPLQRRP